MSPGTKFQVVLGDDRFGAKRLIFVTGKIYYDLAAEIQKRKLDDKISIIRIEELSPFPFEEIRELLKQYGNCTEYLWVQEEPKNQGAYTFVEPRLRSILKSEILYAGRKTYSAPASGVSKIHKQEMNEIMEKVFAGL
jgi:probable 2-oxoglutarate dehydrogenase E1 component DHKTD1